MNMGYVPTVEIIGRQSDTQTGVENHALRFKLSKFDAIVRQYLMSHSRGECACDVCKAARIALTESVIDVFLRTNQR